MTGDHHGRTTRRATLLVTATDKILGTHTVIAETYPREYYRYLGPSAVHGRWSKRRKTDRLSLVPGLLAWAESLPVVWDVSTRRRVESGFSDGRNGEDEFDAVIGLLAMIAVVTGCIDAGAPADDPAVLSIEGWILGRAANGSD